MPNSFRSTKESSPFHHRSEAKHLKSGARAEYIRIARALLGVSPAQLASQIGAPPPPRVSEVARPTQTLDRLSGALQAVIGWYHASIDSAAPQTENRTVGTMGLDTLVHEYLALRSDWENREASRIASFMSSAEKPLWEQGVTQSDWVPTQPADKAGGIARRTALLVDDASDVVITVGAFLEAFGFDVIRESSGDRALEILAAGASIDLLVTDYAMPGITGKDLVVQACQQRPTLRALIITGYPESTELAQLPAQVMLLAKPFRRAALRECVSQLFVVQQPAASQKTAG
jgi:CheY-like chemotaxis protein